MRKRAVFLSFFPDLALGGQKTLLQLVEALHGSVLDASVVVPREGEMSRALAERGVPVDRIAICYPARGMKRDALRGVWALRRVLASRKTDLIYVDGPDQVLPAATAAFGRSTRVLWHVQMSLPAMYDPDNVQLADTMVFCSPALSERFAALPSSARERVVVNAVDCERFAPEGDRIDRGTLGLSAESQLILCVGELSERKGTFDLITAMARLEAPKATLAFVGRGTPEVEARAQRTIAAAGLERRVRLLGYRNDIPALLRSAALVVVPSHSEGMSLALLEAMASGAAVVASDIPANRVVIEPGRGVSYPVGDAEALARAIGELLRDPERAAALGSEARRHVLAHHRREIFVRRFGEAMVEAAQSPRRSPLEQARHLASAWRRRPGQRSK